jgi:hypothetical protein
MFAQNPLATLLFSNDMLFIVGQRQTSKEMCYVVKELSEHEISDLSLKSKQ